MILADKIMMLRKKNGWSQEELAEKLNVSRQSVSKWEGAQSVPDLNKILIMSQIFEVSTDYLLKDEIELEEEKILDSSYEQDSAVRRVSLEEANEFLHIKKMTAGKIATATSICILSPICLLVLAAASETGQFGISENAAAGIGLTVILLMVAAAVAMFISSGMKTNRFEYLEKEPIETEYGVAGMVKDRKNEYQGTYTRHNIIGTCCCIMAAIPLFAAMAFLGEKEDDFIFVLAIAALLMLVSIGVWFFIDSGIRWSSFKKLLQEGEYTAENKKNEAHFAPIASIYWLIATAIYLGISFSNNSWDRSWIIWPIAGVLFAAIKGIYTMVFRRK